MGLSPGVEGRRKPGQSSRSRLCSTGWGGGGGTDTQSEQDEGVSSPLTPVSLPNSALHLHPCGPSSMTAMTLGQHSPYPRAPLADTHCGLQRRTPPRPSVRAHFYSRSMRPLDRRTHTPGGRGRAEGLFPDLGEIWAEAGPRL